MSRSEWRTKLADFGPLYDAGVYTTAEYFWFALPLFDGQQGDKELWDALPAEVKDCCREQVSVQEMANDPEGKALAAQLSIVRRVAESSA